MKRIYAALAALLLVMTAALWGCGSGASAGADADLLACTLSVKCDPAVTAGYNLEDKWKDVIPEDGVILPETQLSLPLGATAFDALIFARDECGIQVEYEGGDGSEYIEGINNLYELDLGRLSGWMYSVNGEFPSVASNGYELKDGDAVAFVYTLDLGVDVGDTYIQDSEEEQ